MLTSQAELRDIVQIEAKEAYVYVTHHDLECYVKAFRDKYIDESNKDAVEKHASEKAASQKDTFGRDTPRKDTSQKCASQQNAFQQNAPQQYESQRYASQQSVSQQQASEEHASQNGPYRRDPYRTEHVARQNATAVLPRERRAKVIRGWIREICQKLRAVPKDPAAEAKKPIVVVDWQCVINDSVDILPYIFVYIRFEQVRWFVKLGSAKGGHRIPFVIQEMVSPYAPSWAIWITENKNVRTVQLYLEGKTVDIALKSACLGKHDWECVPIHWIDACNERISLKMDLGFARIWEQTAWTVNIVVQDAES